jgi:A/G-specific adenine glycosylase
LERFPTVESLAEADAADVVREWGSLGYNRRALNLWRAARAVAERGGFPRTIEGLQELPGVGSYTARAIASFAFDAHCGVVDANVRHVLSRAFGASSALQQAADALVPKGDSATWNQAMIDLGAMVCTARKPSCSVCPLRRCCRWTPDVRIEKTARAPFKQTSRFVRGRIVAELRGGSAGVAALRRRISVDAHRFDEALESLESDGLVHRRRATVALGQPS